MDYKRQTKVLAVMFVLVGMMFIVPAITEKAQAIIAARAHSGVFISFRNVSGHLDSGAWTVLPRLMNHNTEIYWQTRGAFPAGKETGYVEADLLPYSSHVFFHFNSPASGIGNTCAVAFTGVLHFVGTCTIPRVGTVVNAMYQVSFGHPTGANGEDTNSDNEGDDSGDTS
jgi:hypothetical protein